MNDSAEDREDVMVFWDFETSPSSSSAASAISTHEMVKNIQSAIATYGPLKAIRLYWDYSNHPFPSTTLRIRSELSASGVTLIDCPAEGRKEAAAKKMLVDMIFHAWDSPSPFTFVVITGDRDLAYALAMLRMKSYRVVLISPAGSHSELTSQASVQLDWSRTILGINGGSNDDDLFSNHMSPSRPNSPRLEQGAFTFQSVPPPVTSASREPGLAHKPSAFNLFGGFSSPKSTLGLGDGPLLFPRPLSVNQKPLRSRSGSLPDFLRPPAFVNKGKNKATEPDIEHHPPPPPPCSRSRLRSSTSIFEPFDDDESLSSPPGPAVLKPSLSNSSSESRQSKFSFEQISKPTEVTVPEPVEQQPRSPPGEDPTRSSKEPQASVMSGVQQTEANPKPPTLPKTPPPPPVVVPLTTPTQKPTAAKSKKAPQLPPPKPKAPKPKPLVPPAWVPLINTLVKHNGVLSRSKIAPTLLKAYPNAFQTAGVQTIKAYLNAAISAGIVLKSDEAKPIIRLMPRYLS